MRKCWYLWEAAGLLAADQIMKTYAEQNLKDEDEKVLRNRLVLRYVENKGMCLNILENRPKLVGLFSGGAAGAVTCIYAVALVCGKSFLKKQALSLLAAGAWSNTADRFFRGYVVDYIGVKFRSKKLSGITYNIADFLIAAGGIILSAVSLNRHK